MSIVNHWLQRQWALDCLGLMSWLLHWPIRGGLFRCMFLVVRGQHNDEKGTVLEWTYN